MMIYIDDVVVSYTVYKSHDKQLRNVMDRLREFSLLLHKETCEFGVSKIRFTGNIFTSTGVDHLAISYHKALKMLLAPKSKPCARIERYE